MSPSTALTRALRAFLTNPTKNVVSIHGNRIVAREAFRTARRSCDESPFLPQVLKFSESEMCIEIPDTGKRIFFVGVDESRRRVEGVELGSAWFDDLPCADPVVRSRIR